MQPRAPSPLPASAASLLPDWLDLLVILGVGYGAALLLYWLFLGIIASAGFAIDARRARQAT